MSDDAMGSPAPTSGAPESSGLGDTPDGGGGASQDPGPSSLVINVKEIKLLLRYAIERGLDSEGQITNPLHAALSDYERADDGSEAKRDAGGRLLNFYGRLAAKTYGQLQVNGRTILETMDKSRWPFRWVLFAGILFFILSMGTEILDLFYKDYLEPEEGVPLFIVNVHRYILTYLSPFLWGGLGACVYLVKRLADARANLQFERQRFQGLSAHIGLGALLGAVVVLIYGEENFTQSEFNLDANTLAFFVGVGVRVFYSLIESTIETVADGLRRRITGETATHAAPKTDPKATATTDSKD